MRLAYKGVNESKLVNEVHMDRVRTNLALVLIILSALAISASSAFAFTRPAENPCQSTTTTYQGNSD